MLTNQLILKVNLPLLLLTLGLNSWAAKIFCRQNFLLLIHHANNYHQKQLSPETIITGTIITGNNHSPTNNSSVTQKLYANSNYTYLVECPF